MKYLIIPILILLSTFDNYACTCYENNSLCESLGEYVPQSPFNSPPLPNDLDNRIVSYVKYTGNFNEYYEDLYRYEVKVIDLIFGEIQPGGGNFLNSDSTFWVISGTTSCNDVFSFQEGDYALVSPNYGYLGGNHDEYFFSICDDDLFIYPFPLTPVTYNSMVQDIENCLAHLCEEDLVLTDTHTNTAVYKAGALTSTAYVNAEVVYKADDRVSLQSGFKTNEDYSFRVVMDNCN